MLDNLYNRIIRVYSSDYEQEKMINVYIIILFVIANCFFNFFCAFIHYITNIPEMMIICFIGGTSYFLCTWFGLYKKRIVICQYILVINICFYILTSTYFIGYEKNSYILFIPLVFALHYFSTMEKNYFRNSCIIIFFTYIAILIFRYTVDSKYEGVIFYTEGINIFCAVVALLYIIYIKKVTARFLEAYEKIQVKQLKKEINTDFLTNLWNRRYMEEFFSNEVFSENSYVILADVDHFKNINDTYGHINGDYILKELAKNMLEYFRDTDCIGRWGGEEFIIYVKGVNSFNVMNKLNDFRIKMSKMKFIIDNEEVKITLTFGVKNIDKKITINKNIDDADAALYYGKKNGRNQVVYFHEGINN